MISSSAYQAAEAQKSAKVAADTAEAMEKKIRKWTTIGAGGAALTAIAIIISVFSLICDANSRYDNMVQEIKDCTYQINTLEQQLEILQDKLNLYEKTQSAFSEQHSGNISYEENEEEDSLSSSGEEMDFGKP